MLVGSKIEWKQMEGQTRKIALPLGNAVGDKVTLVSRQSAVRLDVST